MGGYFSTLKRSISINNKHLIDQQAFWDKAIITTFQEDMGSSRTAVNHNVIGTEREFHNEETSTYWLPKDDEEQKRLAGVYKFKCGPCKVYFWLKNYCSNTLPLRIYTKGRSLNIYVHIRKC